MSEKPRKCIGCGEYPLIYRLIKADCREGKLNKNMTVYASCYCKKVPGETEEGAIKEWNKLTLRIVK
jgi:hypothetical protein